MKYEELTLKERSSIKKYIKEELLITQIKVKMPINPNEFLYDYSGNALHISGKLKNMDDRQIRSKMVKFIKLGIR